MDDKERMKIAKNNLKITNDLYDKVDESLSKLVGISDVAKVNIALATACSYANSNGIGNKMLKVIIDEMFEEVEEEIEEECASVGSEEDIKVLEELIKTLQTIVEREEK